MRGDKGSPGVSMALTESKHLGTPAIKGANRRAPAMRKSSHLLSGRYCSRDSILAAQPHDRLADRVIANYFLHLRVRI